MDRTRNTATKTGTHVGSWAEKATAGTSMSVILFKKHLEEVGEEPTVTSQAGVDLIKSFEGCELKAYVCPAGVLTIGYGHTGPDVTPGMKITQAEAERLLKQDLHHFEDEVSWLIAVPLTQTRV